MMDKKYTLIVLYIIYFIYRDMKLMVQNVVIACEKKRKTISNVSKPRMHIHTTPLVLVTGCTRTRRAKPFNFDRQPINMIT